MKGWNDREMYNMCDIRRWESMAGKVGTLPSSGGLSEPWKIKFEFGWAAELLSRDICFAKLSWIYVPFCGFYEFYDAEYHNQARQSSQSANLLEVPSRLLTL